MVDNVLENLDFILSDGKILGTIEYSMVPKMQSVTQVKIMDLLKHQKNQATIKCREIDTLILTPPCPLEFL